MEYLPVTGADRMPAGMGELLDRVFSLYRGHFLLFVGIMLPPSLISSLGGLAQPPIDLGSMPAWPEEVLRHGAAFLFSTVLSVAVYSGGLAAATLAVSEIRRGRGAGVVGCYRMMGRRFASMLGLSLLLIAMLFGGFTVSSLAGMLAGVTLGQFHMALAVLGAPILFLGMAATVAWLVRYGVAVPALILGKLSPGGALRRSALLSRGFRPRVALIVFLMLVINFVVAFLLQGPFLMAEVFVDDGVAAPWITFLKIVSGSIAGALSGPFLPIGMTLLYLELLAARRGSRAANGLDHQKTI